MLRAARLIADSWFRADVAQLVEHSLGKGEVTSSILVIGSRFEGLFRNAGFWLVRVFCPASLVDRQAFVVAEVLWKGTAF